MGGGFSAGGLITGLDSNNIIRQLLQIERQPILRFQDRIRALEAQRTAVRDIRSNLLTLRNVIQDFRLGSYFGKFQANSSSENVATGTISSSNPISGAFNVEVVQLATSTVAVSSGRLGAAINPSATLDSSGIRTDVTTGTFTINGALITVDAANHSLNDILNLINISSAGVTATYDPGSDRVILANSAPGDTNVINLGAAGDTSNFLTAIGVKGATQSTNLGGSTEVKSSTNLGAIDAGEVLNSVNFANGAITAGNFLINGTSITVDPATDSLSDVLARINASDANVTASYDAAADGIRIVSKVQGSRTISFTAGTSNFLSITDLATPAQTVGKDSEFKIDGGALQTRNTNTVTDAIGGVTLNLAAVGTTTITVGRDEERALEGVRAFIEAFNSSITLLNSSTAREGSLRSDTTIRTVESALRDQVFQQITGLGSFQSFIDIGITTGNAFDSSAVAQLQLDEDKFLEALRNDTANVEQLFANEAENGVLDSIFGFLDELTSFTGALNQRGRAGGSIDEQIRGLELRIDRVEERIARKEVRLRQQFARLEQVVNGFNAQGQSLSALQNNFRRFIG